MRPPQSLRITQPKLLWAKGFWHTFRQGGALAAHVVWTARRFTQPQGYSAEPSAPVIRPSKVRGKYRKITKAAKLLLAYRSIVLGEVQGVLPSHATIIHGSNH